MSVLFVYTLAAVVFVFVVVCLRLLRRVLEEWGNLEFGKGLGERAWDGLGRLGRAWEGSGGLGRVLEGLVSFQ